MGFYNYSSFGRGFGSTMRTQSTPYAKTRESTAFSPSQPERVGVKSLQFRSRQPNEPVEAAVLKVVETVVVSEITERAYARVVNQHLRDGWELHGYMQIVPQSNGNTSYVHALVKRA